MHAPPVPAGGRSSKNRGRSWRAAERRWQRNHDTLRRWLREYGEAAIKKQFPGRTAPYVEPCPGGCFYYRSPGHLDGTSGADPRLLSSWEWQTFSPQFRSGVDLTHGDGPRVLNAREVGRRSSIYCTVVDRRTKWGNPFEMKREDQRDAVIEQFRIWIVQQPALMAVLPELYFKHLICWCAPKRCHADVLLDLLYHRLFGTRLTRARDGTEKLC